MKVVGQVLRERVREHAHVDFVVCDSERLTYAEAEARSRVLARGLLAEGLGKGSRVALLYPTGIPFVRATAARPAYCQIDPGMYFPSCAWKLPVGIREPTA